MKKVLIASLAMAAFVWGQEGTGAFPSMFEQDPGLRTHTIYRPADLAKLQGRKLPIIAWGNGGCANNGFAHRNFLMEIASYGFLAIAIGPPTAPPTAGKGPAGKGPAADKGKGKQAAPAGPATKSSQLIDAINWAIAENGRGGSQYYGKLDPSKIAVMGMSCGGIQSYAVSEDPRIKLIGIWNSGILNMPLAAGTPAMEDVRKEQLDKLHSPIFYVTGDSSDIAYENGLDDFNRVSKVPALHMYRDGVGHGGTYSQPNGGEFANVGVAMLKWQFDGDQQAAKMFLGAGCGFCQDTAWHVSNKGLK
jgi:hypothetical protein